MKAISLFVFATCLSLNVFAAAQNVKLDKAVLPAKVTADASSQTMLEQTTVITAATTIISTDIAALDRKTTNISIDFVRKSPWLVGINLGQNTAEVDRQGTTNTLSIGARGLYFFNHRPLKNGFFAGPGFKYISVSSQKSSSVQTAATVNGGIQMAFENTVVFRLGIEGVVNSSVQNTTLAANLGFML